MCWFCLGGHSHTPGHGRARDADDMAIRPPALAHPPSCNCEPCHQARSRIAGLAVEQEALAARPRRPAAPLWLK